MISEPSLLMQTVLIWVMPFIAYFAGITIRKYAIPGTNSPELSRQLALGIPISLVIVTPSITVLRSAIGGDPGAYLMTMGVIMEHGMLVQEEATKRVADYLKDRQGRAVTNP